MSLKSKSPHLLKYNERPIFVKGLYHSALKLSVSIFSNGQPGSPFENSTVTFDPLALCDGSKITE